MSSGPAFSPTLGRREKLDSWIEDPEQAGGSEESIASELTKEEDIGPLKVDHGKALDEPNIKDKEETKWHDLDILIWILNKMIWALKIVFLVWYSSPISKDTPPPIVIMKGTILKGYSVHLQQFDCFGTL